MKIAVLSDIHGNIYAFNSVLNEIKKLGVEKTLILGDVLGYYYHAHLVFKELDSLNYELIMGNHEGMLLDWLDNKIPYDKIKLKYGNGLKISAKYLSDDHIQQLRSLRSRKSVIVDEIKIEMCHGSPWDRDEYIYPDAENNILKKCDLPNSDFVLMGHTHHPFVYKGTNALVANVGSVGQSRVMGGVADWAIINTENRSYIPKHTIYDTSELINEVEKNDPELPYLIDVLKRNNQ